MLYRPGPLCRPNITDWLSFLLALGFSLCALGLIALAQQPVLAFGLFLGLGVVVLLWRHPVLSVFMLLFSATAIELFRVEFPDALTEKIAFWRNLSSSGVAPIPVNPAELLMVAAGAFWLLRGLLSRTLTIRINSLLGHYTLYLVMVLFGLLHGIFVGGNTTIALWEVRAPVYCALAFFLGCNLIRSERHVHILGWLFVLGTGFKGVQGAWRYVVTYGRSYDGNELMAHDEAFFFPAYYVYVLLLFALGGSRRQKQVGMLLLPFVITADLANKRRASTAALVICLLVLLVVLVKLLWQFRFRILRWAFLGLVLGAAYTGAFWNSTGALAQPARAIKSNFEPDARDESSNRYRQIEDEELMRQIRAHVIVGQGYGIEMPLPPGMADVRSIAPFMLYMPHNSILWVWWRTGLIGFTLFWAALGSAIIRNCLRARQTNNPLLRRWATFAVGAVIIQLLIGWFDVGLFSFRQGVFVWIVLAIPEVLAQLDAQRVEAVETGTHS